MKRRLAGKKVAGTQILLDEENDYLSSFPYCKIPSLYFRNTIAASEMKKRKLLTIETADGREVMALRGSYYAD